MQGNVYALQDRVSRAEYFTTGILPKVYTGRCGSADVVKEIQQRIVVANETNDRSYD